MLQFVDQSNQWSLFAFTFLSFRNLKKRDTSLKSNLHYTRDITPKRARIDGAHLRGVVPGQHSSDEKVVMAASRSRSLSAI